MPTEVIDGALMTVRTARTRHWCGHGRHWIEPGERYEHWRVPPWRGDGGNETPHWWQGDRHPDPFRTNICDELDAYREKAEREALVNA
jgi:hypothetical protein